MNLDALIKDERTSLAPDEAVDGRAFSRLDRHLSGFKFWRAERSRKPKLWEHQEVALGLAAAYLTANRTLPLEHITNEAGLIKMATGTGKSAVITVLSRCLPQVQRVLVLTPRVALTDQVYRYTRHGFWAKMGLADGPASANFEDDGEVAGAPVPAAYVTKLLPSVVGSILGAAADQPRMVLVGTLQALDQIRRRAAKPATGDAAADAGGVGAQQFLDLLRTFDLVIVDEGHYEPAISWSRAIRDADLPTILFSATPYRNDYKSFRVRGRFVFNQPIQQALAANVIRKPEFRALAGAPASEPPATAVVEVKHAGTSPHESGGGLDSTLM